MADQADQASIRKNWASQAARLRHTRREEAPGPQMQLQKWQLNFRNRPLDRLLPTAKLGFGAVNRTPGCKGIVTGGLAAAMLGNSRKTNVGLYLLAPSQQVVHYEHHTPGPGHRH